jgi:hypothetical protein
MKIKETAVKYAKYAGIGFGLLIVANMVHDNPDGAKKATRESAGQTATGAGIAKDLGGTAVSVAIDNSPVHLSFSNPLNNLGTSANTSASGNAAPTGSSSETHAVVSGDTWWGILGGFGLNGAEIQKCVADHHLASVVVHPGQTVGNPC